MAKQQMSIEAALDEEMHDVLALLEASEQPKRQSTSSERKAHAPSPFMVQQSPVQSMLDIDDEEWKDGIDETVVLPAPRSDSQMARRSPYMAPQPALRSMLDIDDEEWKDGTDGIDFLLTPRSDLPVARSSPFMAPQSSVRSMLDIDDEEWKDGIDGTFVLPAPRSDPQMARRFPYIAPQPPVRSMLDIDDEDWAPRKVSFTGTNGTGVPVSGQHGNMKLDLSSPFRSILDVAGSTGYSTSYIDHRAGKKRLSNASARSEASFSTEETTRRALMGHHGLPHRSISDAASKPASFGPRASSTGRGTEPAYQFSGCVPSNPGGPASPRRTTTLAGKKTSEAARGRTRSFLGDPTDRERFNSNASTTISNPKSKSPAGRSILRSASPLSTDTSKFKTKDGRVIDMTTAYRRLSDAHLARSGGGLSSLGEKQRNRTNSLNIPYPNGARLEKDYRFTAGEAAVVDSSEDDDSISDEGQQRGRKREAKRQGQAKPDREAAGMDRVREPRQPQRQMAAAEEEREQAAAQREPYHVRSLLEPEITVTKPNGDRHSRPTKPRVHPWTSFDESLSGLNTPVDSDAEQDFTDIKRAQNLSVNMTPIISTPATSRCVRTIYRGDFAQMQREAQDHQRRVRKYLVATDLSDEAAHALEWTVGTVLRDGDTLLAIYCVDEDVGIASTEASVGDVKTKEQMIVPEAARKPSSSTPVHTPTIILSPLGPSFALNIHSASTSPVGRERGKAEQERHRAVQDITEKVSKLLRKTKLQVKVVIEVIHCKSPKHLITEVIDYISPTMVILGSRGQSQLKGVILGSFSNYLVTKSSVPVMVARRRLKKHTKYKRPAIRLANNLANPAVKSLATAKID
ncbi:Usp family protein [Diplocarpon rosae]|nr:Usp family protein [Diplocarpon rosae]